VHRASLAHVNVDTLAQQFDTVRSPLANGHPAEPIPDFGTEHHPEDQPPLPTTLEEPETIVAREDLHPPTDDEYERPDNPPASFNVSREESTEEPEHSGVVDADVNVHSLPPPPPLELPAVEPRYDSELLAKYNEAQAEIERLRALLAAVPRPPSTELRRRNRPVSDDGSTVGETEVGTMVEEIPLQQDGVPLQVVVIIALGVFITTYLFF
jgi:vesicle-associated membrane protein-associated protein A